MDNFILFKDILMYLTDTYLPQMAEGLDHYQPIYVGSRKIIEELPMDTSRLKVMNEGTLLGWMREIAFKTMGYPMGIIKALKSYNPVLIHAHYGFGGVLALPIMRKLKIPLVVTFHGHDATSKDEADQEYYTHRLYVRKRSELQKEGRLFLAVSDFIKDKMLAQGYPEDKILTHYIGIDVNVFRPDPSVMREPIVLFVGRLVKNKGGTYLIQAMEWVQHKHPSVELVIIGDGEDREELEVMCQNKLAKYQFLGLQSQEVVRKWMNKAKVLCVPSVTIESGKSEGFGLVFIEANAMGVPVVSFQTGGIREAVEHEQTGFLLPERDWMGLAIHIDLLLENDELWLQLSEQGKQRVSMLFNLQTQKQKLEKIYDSLNHNVDMRRELN